MPVVTFDGLSLESILLAASLLLIISVLASKISSAFGVPVLLLFLAIGMLAGSEGPGQFVFTDYPLSYAIGSACLALILFDGGLGTSWREVRPVLKLASSLSVVGTVVTGVVTGVFAYLAFDTSWAESLLLGAIVSSTDAAAVFSILRSRSLSLKGELKQTLEFEAGSNDPVAIFLTVGMLTYLTQPEAGPLTFVSLLVLQAGLGLGFGWFGGQAMRWLINNVGIEYQGLYGVLLLGMVIFLFGITATLGGSGFLAAYVAGLVIGNSEMLHKGSVTRFQDGLAWLAQILVFLTLGLLVTPSHLLLVWKEGLLLALFMMFVARPLSVLVAAPGAMMDRRSRLFVSWVGLRGAAPIILATLPWTLGIPNAESYFNLIFFVVLASVIFQGISIPWVANALGVTVPFQNSEEASPGPGILPAGFVLVEIRVKPGAAADNKRVVELPLPGGVLLTSIQRDERYLIPNGRTEVSTGDRIRGLARPSHMDALRALFGDVRAVKADS